MKYSAFSAVLASIATQAEAFWGTAHLLVSRHAESLLQDQNPDVLAAALDELAVLKKYYASLTKDEDQHPFTECATFADNIKGQGYSFQSNWHFINQPYLDEEGTTIDDFPDFNPPDVNVVDALDDLTKFLRNEISASDSTYTQQIADHFSYDADQRSFALRLIIHYVGDVHQPLHSTALVDSKYPSGDRGGNNEHIPSKDGASNLHAVWDAVIYDYTGFPDLPLNDSDWDWYTSEDAKLADEYPISSDELKAQDYNAWAAESLQISETIVYPDFVENQDPDQDYIDAAKPVAEARIIQGGARLAALMNYIYGSSSIQSFLQ